MSKGPLASDTAMVMAAGLGKRMLPLTATTPKPLIEVGGRKLIDYMIDHLADAGVAQAVVNVHYLADQVEAYLAGRTSPQVAFSDERAELLETGGGMVRAWRAGDRMRPLGMDGTKAVAGLMAEKGLPRPRRREWPVRHRR